MTTTDSPSGFPSTSAPATRRGLGTTDLALVAAFAALIAACALIGGIPVGGAGVELTLQTFGILLAGCVLGPTRGFLAVLLYLGLGAIGLPVFSGREGGLGPFVGSSAGYLWSFPLVAGLAGLLVARVAGRARRSRAFWVFVCAVPGVLLNHALGIVGMKYWFDVPWSVAWGYDAPFWAGDVLKAALVALVAAEVRRAFPQLLGRSPVSRG
ncbi:biotin transporter BioY [Nocardioides sp. zg-579]|uniref:Biotin transporter n=1 Tax=Nocardioides marmotae TaxID=2663857 RepID=A0A6I3JB69_9ACTN|nr:biotin transporter BioY [Nocardioides marmotae]MCR6031735.1 biotin transporter BioY [Gordonia jinghuaiqii]MTB95374.1 biotin transporter BioY [Nocardioides marmotae]QKE00822.1 biotin transporter BioY [Nocardioides marmotae]